MEIGFVYLYIILKYIFFNKPRKCGYRVQELYDSDTSDKYFLGQLHLLDLWSYLLSQSYLRPALYWHKSMQTWSRVQLIYSPNVRMRNKCDLTDFDYGMNVGARQDGFSISETADLLGFSHTTVSRVCREWCEKKIQRAAVLWAKTACK